MSDTFAAVPEIPDELVDQLLAGQPLTAEAITGPDGLLKQLTKRLVERAMSAELAGHLGYEPGEPPPAEQANRRNGSSEDADDRAGRGANRDAAGSGGQV